MSFSSALTVLSSGMQGQAGRLTHIAENIANADTPGYRRKTVEFRATYAEGRPTGAIEMGPVRLDRSTLPRVYDPGHPLADADGYFDGSNVNLVTELADAREAQRSYEASVKMFEQVRRMSSALTDILNR